MVLDIDTSNSDGTSINIWNVLTDQSIFRTLPYTVDFYRPRIKFWATFLPESSGMGYCPRANMALLSQLTTKLDLFVFGPNEMNGNELVEFMPDAQNTLLSETYSTVQTDNQKEWLESFTFEDIYFRRVPALPH